MQPEPLVCPVRWMSAPSHPHPSSQPFLHCRACSRVQTHSPTRAPHAGPLPSAPSVISTFTLPLPPTHDCHTLPPLLRGTTVRSATRDHTLREVQVHRHCDLALTVASPAVDAEVDHSGAVVSSTDGEFDWIIKSINLKYIDLWPG